MWQVTFAVALLRLLLLHLLLQRLLLLPTIGSSVAVYGIFVVHTFVSFYCTHLVFWPLFGTCGLFMVALLWVMVASRAPTIVS